jgi:hypothetical protein
MEPADSLLDLLVALKSQNPCVRGSVAAYASQCDASRWSAMIKDGVRAARQANDHDLVKLLGDVLQQVQGHRKAKQPACPLAEAAPVTIG